MAMPALTKVAYQRSLSKTKHCSVLTTNPDLIRIYLGVVKRRWF
jgi:hypothetical protein